MAWITDAQRDYTIKTGDGKSYKVNWLQASRANDFNFAQFNFRGVKGTLVVRSEIMGTTYDVEIFLQGADNLKNSADFKKSSEDKRAWQISHPLYGAIAVQPLSLKYDDSNLNITKITGQVMETIGVKAVGTFASAPDVIQAKKKQVDKVGADSFAANVPEPDTDVITSMQDNITLADRLQAAFATVSDNAELITNTYHSVNTLLDNARSDIRAAISGVQTMLSLPAIFADRIENRVNFFIDCANEMYADISALELPDLKRLYENNISAILTSVCYTSVFDIQPTDYPNRVDALKIVTAINDFYNSYITNLNNLQTDTGDTPDSYIPDFESINQLSQMVYYTIANLFNIAANAKQQRVYELPADSNLILLADLLYGLLPDDSTIDQLIADNNLSGNEFLNILKGRNIIYYI